MSHQYISENANSTNIDVCPKVDSDHVAVNGTQISVGDLHGNAVKLLYILVRHGIAQISPEDYNKFVNIYRTNTSSITKNNIKEFNEIISNIKLNNEAKTSKLSLIGDILADRGMNDYFTLKLLKKLQDNNMPVDIMISNHDAEFIKPYETKTPFNRSMLMGQANSANNLQDLIDQNIVSREEIIDIVESSYKPNLKLLSYSLDDTQSKITIYSHAAIGLNNIKIMAEKLGVTYLGNDAVSLAKTIDAMNIKFSTEFVAKNKVSELLNLDKVSVNALNGQEPIDSEKFPFAHLIWNRFSGNLERPESVIFVHGHDKNDLTQKNIVNLDNDLGKILSYHDKGVYNALFSKTFSKLERKLEPSKVEENIDEFDTITDKLSDHNPSIDLQTRLNSILSQLSSQSTITQNTSHQIDESDFVWVDLEKEPQQAHPNQETVHVAPNGKRIYTTLEEAREAPLDQSFILMDEDYYKRNPQFRPQYSLLQQQGTNSQKENNHGSSVSTSLSNALSYLNPFSYFKA